MMREIFPKVRFIQSDKNLGFARSNNVAFHASSGRSILFLNPDTELEEAAIETLYHQLNSLPNVGVVGGKLLNTGKTIQKSCIRSFPSLLTEVIDSEVLRRWFSHSRLWGMAPLFTQSQIPTEVDAVSGACLMIKRSVFESVEMFSTEYFMYSEDVDLCYKVRELDWKTCYVPNAVIIHHGGASSSKSNVSTFSSVMMLESRWRFFLKTRPIWYSWLFRPSMFIVSIVRLTSLLLIWPIYAMRGRETLIRNIKKKWTAKLRWTLGGEGWVRNC